MAHFLRTHTPEKRDWKFQGSIPLLVVVLLLSVWGSLMVYSGSVIVAVRLGYAPNYYFIRQIVWVFIGFICLYLCYKIDYHQLVKLATPGMVAVIILLLLVLLVNFSNPIKRWINLGPFDLQPSELAKFAFLVYLSTWLAKHRDHDRLSREAIKKHLLTQLLPFILLLSFVTVLILIEPDLDTAIILGATSFIVYFISGNDFIHLLGSIFTGFTLGLFTVIATFLARYRITRFETFLNFWQQGSVPNPFGTGYQMRQILVAVASGGLFGVGFGESRQKFHYLGDTAFSDTIFAIFAEEFGLFGCIIIISLFAYLLLKGLKIAQEAPDKLGFLLASSMTIWLVLQAFMHIAANVALLPINGNTLPFFSYGGSSTIVNLAAVGIILNISKNVKTKIHTPQFKRVRR